MIAASRTLTALAFIAVSAVPLMAEDEVFEPLPFSELRFGIQQSAAPAMKEQMTANASQDWKVDQGSTNSYATRLSVEWIKGTTSDGIGLIYGAELGYAWATLTNQAENAEATYRNLGVDLLIGPQYGINGYNGFRGHIELVGFAGAGYGTVRGGAGNSGEFGLAYGFDSMSTMTWEMGLRAGAFVSERNILAGVTVGYVTTGAGDQDVSNARGATSNVDLSGEGARWGILVGGRF